MPRVLTTNAVITCPHGGTGTSTPTSLPPKALVNGGAILLHGDTGTLAGCANSVQCAGYTLSSLGLNASFVDGRRVMLATDFLQSATGFPLTVSETHSVFDQTTPTPLPPGATPSLPPELREDDVPVVVAAPPTLAFSIGSFGSSGLPAALPYTFTLTSLFPRSWTLGWFGPARGEEITTGVPPAITVVPAGGAWAVSPLAVVVTVTGAFASTLAVGTYTFLMTGVNHRGLWSSAAATLVVSA